MVRQRGVILGPRRQALDVVLLQEGLALVVPALPDGEDAGAGIELLNNPQRVLDQRLAGAPAVCPFVFHDVEQAIPGGLGVLQLLQHVAPRIAVKLFRVPEDAVVFDDKLVGQHVDRAPVVEHADVALRFKAKAGN